MNRKIFSRMWFYFRTGWGTYFAFIFSAINTLVVTYYLAIEEIPFLLEIFPSFGHYVTIIGLIGIPLLASVGYIHFKRLPAYASEVDISVEQNPYANLLIVITLKHCGPEPAVRSKPTKRCRLQTL